MSKEAQPLDNSTPRTEEEIRAYTIGELKPLSSRILIVDVRSAVAGAVCA